MKSKDLKRLAFSPVKAALGQIDFVSLYKRMARLEPGRSYLERHGPPEPAFPDQEEIILRTIEYTKEALTAKGESVSEREIEEHARSISCRYDYEIHRAGRASVFTLVSHLFEHEDIDRIFVSADRRELAHIEKLRQARRDGTGVLYLINHSSHWDEFVTILVLDQQGINMPLFAAGANMMATPSLERIMMTGSYLIVRRGASKVYLATLFQYCRALGEMGKQQGIFLEAWAGGARTRDGSLRFPRRLVTLQGALASTKDILIQPVVISYSAVPEDLSLSERQGSLTWLNGLKLGRSLLRHPFHWGKGVSEATHGLWGRSFITFCRPRMLSELDEMRAKNPSDLSRDEFISLYSMREIARDKKIMGSQLTARGIVRAQKEGTEDLAATTRAEKEAIRDYHQRTFGHDPDFEDFILHNSIEDVVADGLRMLTRRRVIKAPSHDKPVEVLARNALSYYATHADRRLYSPSAKENLVVVGAGPWGYGFACLIGNRTLEEKRYLHYSLTLFDPREELVQGIVETRNHAFFGPETRLPKNFFLSGDAVAAFRKATDVVITTPPEAFESSMRRLLIENPAAINVIIATRGFEQTAHRLPIEIARSVLEESGRGNVRLLVLSGPVTPRKLAEEQGGSLVLAGPASTAHSLSDLFKWGGFSVFVSDDPIGVQVAGIMAEVYTLLGSYLLRTKELQGRSQIATFLIETSAEAMRLAAAMGGRPETFMAHNPAWAALYVVLSMGGPASRFGRQAGRQLGKATQVAREHLAKASAEQMELEWHLIAYTGIRSAYLTAKRLNLEMPHLRQAYRIFWKD